MTMGAGASGGGRVAVNAWRQTGALMSALGTAFVNLLAPDRTAPRVELAAGDEAPDFSLAASDGRTYRLSELRGRVVVMAWFPKAFTTGCTWECRSIGLSKQALGGFDATIFAASCDTVDINREFAASTGIDVPILSDPDKSVARAYGVLGPLGRRAAGRFTSERMAGFSQSIARFGWAITARISSSRSKVMEFRGGPDGSALTSWPPGQAGDYR